MLGLGSLLNALILGEERKAHGFLNFDHVPIVPVRKWRKGKIYVDELDLLSAPAGKYRVKIGLYGRSDGEKMRVEGTEDNCVNLGWIKVG